MDDERNGATAYQAGICPYCGSRELNFSAEEADFAPASARKRVVCCDCGRKHQIQYRPVGMRIYEEAYEPATSRDITLPEAHSQSQCAIGASICPMRQIVSPFPRGLPARVRWLIGLHLATGLLFLLLADKLDTPDYLTICWFALLHIQVGLLGVWIGAGGPLAIARGLIVIVVGSATTLLLSLADANDLDEFIPWLLPEVLVAAGLFALVGQFGYRFRADRHGLTRAENLQFSILHLLGLMTAIGVLVFLASGLSSFLRSSPADDVVASLSFAGINALGILIVCWAVLSGAQVVFRCGLALAAILGLAFLLLVGIDEWDVEAIIFVCVAACFVFAALVTTFGVFRSAGLRFARKPSIDDAAEHTQ